MGRLTRSIGAAEALLESLRPESLRLGASVSGMG
jgi:hypothetical protein